MKGKLRFTGLRQRFETEGPGVQIVVMVNHTVANRLNRHIRNAGKAMGGFLRQPAQDEFCPNCRWSWKNDDDRRLRIGGSDLMN